MIRHTMNSDRAPPERIIAHIVYYMLTSAMQPMRSVLSILVRRRSCSVGPVMPRSVLVMMSGSGLHRLSRRSAVYSVCKECISHALQYCIHAFLDCSLNV